MSYVWLLLTSPGEECWKIATWNQQKASVTVHCCCCCCCCRCQRGPPRRGSTAMITANWGHQLPLPSWTCLAARLAKVLTCSLQAQRQLALTQAQH
eukprot:1158748-Pelagomonas_calceolata.AAC.24